MRFSSFNLFAAALCSVMVSLGGCSTLYLHSDARDKQGEDLKKAWAAVQLDDVISTERKNLKSLLATELETQDLLAAEIRNQAVAAMLGGNSIQDVLGARVDAELTQLTTQPSTWRQYAVDREANNNALKTYIRSFPLANLPFSTCADLLADSAKQTVTKRVEELRERHLDNVADMAGRAFTDGVDLCQKWRETEAGYIEKLLAGGGVLGNAIIRLQKDTARREEQTAEAKQAQATLQQAIVEYDEAVRQAEPSPSMVGDLKKKANQLGEAVKALEKLPDSLSIAVLSKERLSAIDNTLKGITEAKAGEKPPGDATPAAKTLILLGNWADENELNRVSTQKLLIPSFLLRKDYERLRFEAAQRDIAAQEAVIKIDQDIIDVLGNKINRLKTAKDILDGTCDKPADATPAPSVAKSTAAANSCQAQPLRRQYGDKPLLTVLKSAPKADRVKIYSAIDAYLDAIDRVTAKQYKLEYTRIAAQHERALALSEVNLKQWNTLISTTVEQQASFGASGIKVEQVTGLINAAGILWIGKGVNK